MRNRNKNGKPKPPRPLIFRKSALDKIYTKTPSLHPNRKLLAVNNQYPLGQQTGRAERRHIFCKYTFNHTATSFPVTVRVKSLCSPITGKLPQCVCISVLIFHRNRVITSHKRLVLFPRPVDFQYTFLQKNWSIPYPAPIHNIRYSPTRDDWKAPQTPRPAVP